MSRPLFTVKGGSFEATKPSREVSDWINEWLVPVTAVPVFRMGGLSPAWYATDDPSEADGWLVEVTDDE